MPVRFLLEKMLSGIESGKVLYSSKSSVRIGNISLSVAFMEFNQIY